MATLRQNAQDMIDVAREGIGWIALWKDGKGWMSMDLYPDYHEPTEHFTFEDYELEKLRAIFRLDPEAILVNGYYYNLGDPETMTRDSLAAALRWQYENGSGRVLDLLLKLHKETKGETA